MPASTLKPNVLGPAKSDSSLNEVKKDRKVHFADTIGLSLVSVYFIRDPAPQSRVNNTVPGHKIRQRFFEKDERARLLNFLQPFSGECLRERLDKNNVCLENVTLREYLILGIVKVKNLTYEKRVFIRYTINNWKSCREIEAYHVYGSNTGTTDTFSFELVLPCNLEKDFKVEFAICYEVLGVQFWDNNSGDNFRIMWYSYSQRKLKRRDLWDIFQSSRYAGFWI